ncbi:MAG: methionine synthase, partial [Gemmatimonadetes bacterium]
WELRGRFPDLFDDPDVGEQARRLHDDALRMLETIVREERLEARAAVGLFAAAREGDDVAVFADAERSRVQARLRFLRQQFAKGDARANACLADFVLAEGDHIGAFAVTAGHGLDELVAGFEAAGDDYSAILARALADRLAEAGAEWLHRQVRTDLWGYAPDERLTNEALIAEAYTGIRPAPGYPACPDHTEKRVLFELLDAERRTGLTLTESFAMVPTAAVAGWYFAHPDAYYFGVGRLGRDQVEDYAARKGWSLAEAERWLAPNLGYDP